MKTGKPAAEKNYLLDGQQNGTGQTGGVKDSAKAPPTLDGKASDTANSKKDVRADNGTPTTGQKRGVDHVDGAKEKPKKKAKDSQGTTSKAMNISVDPIFLDEIGSFSRKSNLLLISGVQRFC